MPSRRPRHPGARRPGWFTTVLLLAAIGAAKQLAQKPTPVHADAGTPAPEIAASAWLNSGPTRLQDLRGKVALIEFWTFGCYNCRNVEPHVKAWAGAYADRGLVVIGVHTPETAYERDVENVGRYVREHGLSYSVAIDDDFTTWQRYGNHAWPAWYLIDKHGIIRYAHVGEGAYAETEHEIKILLSEP